MRRKWFCRVWLLLFLVFAAAGTERAFAQRQQQEDLSEFGPVVRAYLGYLRNEQEVVDDRASRHEIKRGYYIETRIASAPAPDAFALRAKAKTTTCRNSKPPRATN